MSLDVELSLQRDLETRSKRDPLFKNLEYYSLSSQLVHTKVREYYASELKKKGNEAKPEVVNFYLGAAVREIRRLIFLRYPDVLEKDYVQDEVIMNIQKQYLAFGVDNNLMRNFIKFQLCDAEVNMMKKNEDNMKDFKFRHDKGQENEDYHRGRHTHDVRSKMKYHNLTKVTFKGLELNEVNFGKEIELTIVDEGYSVKARHLMCSDKDGIFKEVYLYNMTEQDLSLVRKDIVLIVKHPYYKVSIDGTAVIRIDRKERVQFMLDGIKDPEFFNTQGKNYFKGGDFLSATYFYDKAFKLKKNFKYLNNLCLCFMKVNNFEGSLGKARECKKLCEGKKNDLEEAGFLKACYFEVLSLIKLTKYDEALKIISSNVKTLKGFKKYEKTLLKIMETSKKQFGGEFNLQEMFDNLKAHYDITDYSGPYVIRDAGDKGRGCFATRDIKRGELVCVSKAFSSVFLFNFVEEHHNVYFHQSELSVRRRTDAFSQLRSKIFKKISLNPELKQKVMMLARTETKEKDEKKEVEEEEGKEKESEEEKKKKEEGVNDEIIADIINTNAYDLKYTFSRLIGLQSSQGLFVAPALFNHRCTYNVNWYCVGDVLFLIAVRDVKKGEELNVSYFSFEKGGKDKEEYFKHKKFKCDCKLCDGSYDIDDPEFQLCRDNVKKRVIPLIKNFDKDWKMLLRLKKKYDDNPLMINVYRYFLPCAQFDYEKGRLIMEGMLNLFIKFPFISFNSFVIPFLSMQKYGGLESRIWRVFETNFGTFSKQMFRILIAKPVYVEEKLYQYAKKKADTKVKLVQCGYKYCEKMEKKKNEFKLCSRCGQISYCSRECQKKDWKYKHKKICKVKKK